MYRQQQLAKSRGLSVSKCGTKRGLGAGRRSLSSKKGFFDLAKNKIQNSEPSERTGSGGSHQMRGRRTTKRRSKKLTLCRARTSQSKALRSTERLGLESATPLGKDSTYQHDANKNIASTTMGDMERPEQRRASTSNMNADEISEHHSCKQGK